MNGQLRKSYYCKNYGDPTIIGRYTCPPPTKLEVYDLPAAATVSSPVLRPVSVGVKVTLMVQAAPPARLEGQSLVWVKSPPAAMLVIVIEATPVFFKVMAWGGLVEPIF